jgi:hypothetical protein
MGAGIIAWGAIAIMCPIGDGLGDRFSGINLLFLWMIFCLFTGWSGEAFGRGFSVFEMDF